MKEKVAVSLGASDFMSVLSVGSQARKTGKKGLVLVRTEINGILNCFVSSILEMTDYG